MVQGGHGLGLIEMRPGCAKFQVRLDIWQVVIRPWLEVIVITFIEVLGARGTDMPYILRLKVLWTGC